MKLKFEKKYILGGITAFLVIAASILFVYFLFYGTNISDGFNFVISVSKPVIYALILAYVMTPILKFIETKWLLPLAKKLKWSVEGKSRKRIRALGIFMTAVFVVFVVYGIISMFISQVIPSIQEIIRNFDRYVTNLTIWVNKLFEDNPGALGYIQNMINEYSLDLKNILYNRVLPQTSVLLKSVSLGLIGLLKLLWNLILGLIISIYLLSCKETLAGQAKKIIYAIFKTPLANGIIKEIRFVNQTFTGFLSGKIVDSIIIGLLCFIGTTIIGTPYAILVSIIIGVTNVIPFFGPYLGAIPSCLFILIVDFAHPMNCVYFAIFILILQQFDGNILGPKILGDSTGLSGFWVIFSITVFGGLFGVMGMIIGVPIFAVFFSAIKRIVNYLLKKKNLPTNTENYLKVGSIDTDNNFTKYVPAENKKMFSKKSDLEEKDKDNQD